MNFISNNDLKIKEKKLYKCKYNVDENEYKNIINIFSYDFFIPWIFVATVFSIVLAFIIYAINIKQNIYLLFIFIEMMTLIFFFLSFKKLELYKFRKIYNNYYKYYMFNGYIYFYKNFLTIENNYLVTKDDYTSFSKCIETDTSIYLKYKDSNTIIAIKKDNCDLELIKFIQDTFKNIKKKFL